MTKPVRPLLLPRSIVVLTAIAALGGAVPVSGCGYSTIQARPNTPEAKLVVVPEQGGLADAAAVESMVLGARAALAAEGALGSADEGSPTLHVRLLRLDESTAGTRLADEGGSERVEGRGSRLVLRGEATLRVAGSGPRATPQTFEAAVAEPVAFHGSEAAEARSRDDAIREMARILGRELVLRALGRSDGGTGRRAGGMWYGLAP